MSQPVLLRASSLLVAVVRLAQSLLPPLIIASTLYVIAWAYDVEFDRMFMALAALAAILGGILVHPKEDSVPVLRMDAGALAVDTLFRWAIAVALLMLLGYISKFSDHFSRRVMLTWVLAVPVLLFLTAFLLRLLMRRVVISRENERTAVIVGMNMASRQLADRLLLHPELGTRMVGFFDDRGAERLDVMGGFPLLGRLTELVEYAKVHRIDVIFVALPVRHLERVATLLEALHDSTASIYYVPDVFVFDLIQSRTIDVMGVPVVAMRETPFYGYRGVMKRVTDLALTSLMLLVAIVPMLGIAVLVKLSSKGPAIFRQRRYGLDSEEIVVYKFRTMRVAEDGAVVTQATRDDPRVTSVGRILRRFSLDELPQLFNVLQGRMSLVGPRPHAVAHNEQYRRLIKGYMIRHKVLPGITGLAQVKGLRGETVELEQMQARVNYDLEYLRRWSPSLDLKILIRTVLLALFDRKAY